MTNEEMERAIEFLLKNQAAFEARLGQTNQQLEQTNHQLEQLSQQVGLLAETQTEFIQATLQYIESQGEINSSLRRMLSDIARISEGLIQAQVRTDERLVQAQAADRFNGTDERLNRLAELVERHIREGHNGRS